MGRRRPNWNRNKKRADGTTSKDNWRQYYDTAAAGSNKDGAYSNWETPSINDYDWYGKVDIPSVTLWDDSGVREAWELAEKRKALPASSSAFVPDLYNESNIDWNVQASCSIPESAEETDIITERGWATNAHEDTICKSSSVAGRPQSPVILGLVELQQAKGFTGWESPADAQIVPTGWDMLPEVGPEATGWENNVQQIDTWAVPAQLAKIQIDNNGWEPTPSWPQSSGTHANWSSPAVQSAPHVGSTHPLKDLGDTAQSKEVVSVGRTAGWESHELCENSMPPPAAWPTQSAQPMTSGWGQDGQENRGATYGWDDYPCYTYQASQAAQEGSNWWAEANHQANEGVHDSWTGQETNLQQGSYIKAQEPLQVRRQECRRTAHARYGHGRRENTPNAKQWDVKQVWSMAPTFTQVTKLY